MHPSLLGLQKSAGEIISSKMYMRYQRKLYQVQMLQDRGYSIEKDERNALKTPQNFHDYFKEIKENQLSKDSKESRLNRIYTRSNDDHRISVIYYIIPPSAKGNKSRQVEILTTRMEKEYENDEADDFIIVSNTPIKHSDWFKEIKFQVEFFNYNNMTINPTRHWMSQKHKLLTPKEKNNFIQETGIQPRELPGISLLNPMVTYYNAKVHDIFYITRETSLNYYMKEFVYYREVRDIPLVASTLTAGGEDAEEAEEEGDEGAPEDEGVEAGELF